MDRLLRWAGLCIATLLLSAGTVRAQQGCEFTTAIDFFQSVIEPNGECRWSEGRELYECRRQGLPEWDLMVSSPEPGVGRTVAYRDDGFAVIYGCTCGSNCAFYSPASLSGRAEAVEPGNWLCTSDSQPYSIYSGDLWGASCSSHGGMFAQVQGYNTGTVNGTSTWWLFVFNGSEGDPGCLGQLSCTVTFQEPGGPPHEVRYGPGDHGFQLDYTVQSLELQCFCE
jgi:hypothetical protein